ncbi:MAG: TolC family protein [Mucilaginibacter sp.]|nr:TolC family protein [Mucilaginibacter sp.]
MIKLTCILATIIACQSATAQDTVNRVVSVKELFTLTESKSQQLKISHQNISINEANTAVVKSARLPEISSSVDAGYLSTIAILKPDFSWEVNAKNPHFTNDFFIELSQTFYKGGAINLGVARSKLAEELSRLNYENDNQNIKLLILGQYLDLFQLYNQRIIYRSNIVLADHRLEDLKKLRQQGLVTGNDLIRSELQIADFHLDLDHVENSITITNNDLCEVLGLSFTRIIPDTSFSPIELPLRSLADYKTMADQQQPSIKAAGSAEKIAAKNVEIEKSSRLPEFSLYAENALQRPFLYTLEPLDVYHNAYQVGLRVRYNISSIYKAKDRIDVAKLEYEQRRTNTLFARQTAEIEVNTAFTLLLEAHQRFRTLQKSLELANDNFRIVQKKYLNQLAQITDMLDASTAKLSAELSLNNARINIINQWYKLQKAVGNF